MTLVRMERHARQMEMDTHANVLLGGWEKTAMSLIIATASHARMVAHVKMGMMGLRAFARLDGRAKLVRNRSLTTVRRSTLHAMATRGPATTTSPISTVPCSSSATSGEPNASKCHVPREQSGVLMTVLAFGTFSNR